MFNEGSSPIISSSVTSYFLSIFKLHKIESSFLTFYSKKSYVLKGAETRAKAQGLKMPPIDYTLLEKNGFNVFYNENDADCPVIIHIGLKGYQEYNPKFDPMKEDYCSTYNFTYSHAQCEELIGLSEFIVKKYHEDITEVIRMVIQKKAPH